MKLNLTNFEFQLIELALMKLQASFITEANDFVAACDVKEILKKMNSLRKKEGSK